MEEQPNQQVAVRKGNTGVARAKQTGNPYPPKDSNMLITTLAVGAAGVLGFFGYEYYKKKKSGYSPNSLPGTANYLPSMDTGYNSNKSSSDTTRKKKGKHAASGEDSSSDNNSNDNATDSNGGFPLRKGSKGDKVKQMQQALMSKYGNSILPKYGADGDFGSEVARALKKKGLPSTISESTYNVIIGGGGGGDSNLAALGTALHSAAENNDFNTALSLLKKIDSTGDYQQVSTAFEDNRLDGVRQTLVNGMMDTFSTDDQKQQIRTEFLRMGLQYDGNKWSLSGFDGLSIVTKVATTIWVNGSETVKVPAKMVLGNEVGKRGEFTLFENNGKYFLVKTAAIKRL